MPTGAAQAMRIDPEVLIEEYERARQDEGIGDRGWRLTPGQHLDLHRLIATMRVQDGIAEAGAELDVWVNYLAPVLAESGLAKRLLRGVLEQMLDDHVKAIEEAEKERRERERREGERPGSLTDQSPIIKPVVDQGKALQTWLLDKARRLGASFETFLASGRRVMTVVLIVGGIVGVGFFTFSAVREDPSIPSPPDTRTERPRDPGTRADLRTDAAARVFGEVWEITSNALRSQEFMAGGLTPRRLAAVYAGADGRLGTPDALLANLMRAWPVPPDGALSIAPTVVKRNSGADEEEPTGLWTLRRLAAEVATLRSGLPRILFEPHVSIGQLPSDAAATPAQLSAVLAQNPRLEGPVWSNQWLWFAAAPFVGYFLFMLATHRRRVRTLIDRWMAMEQRSLRRSLRRSSVLEGIKQTSAPLMKSPPSPFVDREALRSLIRYRPAAGRRLDAPRSVAALIHQEGIADPIMRRVQRTVSYLIIIQRRQPHDHERLRVRRLFAHLADRGLPFFAYDYDDDPLTVKHAIAASGRERAEGINGREGTLALSTLRDLHSEARLVLVTDGRDLVDRASGRVRGEVAKTLAFWRERMILTPVPVGDWGEVELALSRDLDAPLGRTGEEAVSDLAQGFRSALKMPPHRAALMQARSAVNAGMRLDMWWQAISERFGFGATLSRGNLLSFDQGLFATDLPPSQSTIHAIRNDLYRWLGPRGFLWHAACAIYPQLRYDLTVHIGRVLRAGPQADAPFLLRDTPEDRRTFDRMTALPWFRAGRMPEWLRRDMVEALEAEALERATAVIRDLFNEKPGRAGPLAIWWPRTGALTMPPDAVMVDTLLGGAARAPATVSPERTEQLRNAAERVQLVREAKAASIAALACAGLWYFSPDFSATPHPLGAWFPLFSFIAACAAVIGLLLWARKQGPENVPAAPPVETATQAPAETAPEPSRIQSDAPPRTKKAARRTSRADGRDRRVLAADAAEE